MTTAVADDEDDLGPHGAALVSSVLFPMHEARRVPATRAEHLRHALFYLSAAIAASDTATEADEVRAIEHATELVLERLPQ